MQLRVRHEIMLQDKIKTRTELARICRGLKKQHKKIGFTSGVFDLLHAGHVDYFQQAKKFCDILIVGLNSDESVKKFKGPARPVIPEKERARVIAALAAVDYIFIFNERRNKRNIEIIKPHYYIKAGDYSPEQLTSKEVVESVGGEVKMIPVTIKTSATEIINKIASGFGIQADRAEKEKAVCFPSPPKKTAPAIFLDRDGTINREIEYLHEPEKFELLPNVVGGLKKMQAMGYRMVIVTAQAGIGLGYFSSEDFYRVNRKMLKQFSDSGVMIDKIYFCPHSKTENCSCRKPNIALLTRAKEELNLDLSKSWTIGDKTTDIESGRRAGTGTILVKTGYAGKDKEFKAKPDYIARDLLDAANYILKTERT
ncbi:HAD-IIIA family hydrolase [bacterium]|nr:HAD-IIIA family hydrolase [bacterium]